MLKIFDTDNYNEVASFNMGTNSVTDIVWHPVLNQIFLCILLIF